MKRIVCFVIAFSVLLSTLYSISVMADTRKYDESLYASRYKTLVNFGVLPDSFGKKSYTDKATYGDFASFISKLTGFDQIASSVIKFDENNKDICIDYIDAAKILLAMLGWNADFIKKDVSYLSDKYELNAGLPDVDNFEVYHAVIMMYNSLAADMLEQTAFGDKNRYEKTGITLAEMYKNAYYFEGIVSANKYGTISDKYDIGDDHVVTEDTEYGILDMKCDTLDTYSMLGARVQGFYKKDGNTKTLVSIDLAQDTDILVIGRDSKPYYNKSKNQIEYYENGKLKNAKISFASDIVYNGQYVSDNVTGILDRINDTSYCLENIILISNDSKSGFDLADINMYYNVVVEGTSAKDFKIYCKGNKFLSFADDYEKGLVFIEKSNGEPAQHSDIKPECTISVFEGVSDKKCVRLVINNGKITAKADYKSEGVGSYTKFGFKLYDEQDALAEKTKAEYEFASESDANNIRIGDTYDLYFDFCGYISYACISQIAKKNFGLFVKAAVSNNGLEKNNIDILMMTDIATAAEPGLETVRLAKNALVDGNKILADNLDQINKNLFHTMVTYYTTSDGKIREMVSADTGSDDSLISKNRPNALNDEMSVPDIKKLMFIKNPAVMFQNTDANVRTGEGHFDISFAKNNSFSTGLVPYNDVKIVCVPDISISDANDTYKDSFYKVLPIETTEYFHNTSLAVYKITAYYEKDEVNPRFIVYTRALEDKPESYKEMTWHDRILLVNTVSKVSNPIFGNTCLKINCIYGGQKLDFYTKADGIRDYSGQSTYVDVGDGDLLFVSFDPNGYITYGLKFYDYDPETKNGRLADFISDGSNYEMYRGYNNVSETFAWYIFMEGYVYNEGISNSGITLATDYEAMENDGKYGGIYGFGNPIKHIYCFDTEYDKTPEKRVNAASLNSGLCYYEDKEHTSKMVVRMRAGNTMDVVIYR